MKKRIKEKGRKKNEGQKEKRRKKRVKEGEENKPALLNPVNQEFSFSSVICLHLLYLTATLSAGTDVLNSLAPDIKFDCCAANN